MIFKKASDLEDFLKQRNEILNPPEADNYIWRYYPLDKFLCLLTSSQLFFSQASSFEDLFEGDYGDAAKQKIREQYGDGQYLRDYNTYDFLRDHTYISCWHENQHESDAMWKLYGNAVAVKARFSNISDLLTWSETEVKYSGRVHYIDFSTEHVNVESSYLPYFFKRLSFAHEKEVRFLIQEHRHNWDDYPQPTIGKLALLDINNTLEEIVLSPTMEAHIADAVEQVIRQSGVSIEVRRSVLLNRPVW